MKNKLPDLRDHLFEAIEMVKSGEMKLDQAKVISDLAQRLINSAKVEVDFINATGAAKGTGFIENDKPKLTSYQGKKK